jgi:hypothetical protein
MSFQLDGRASESIVTRHPDQPAPTLATTYGGAGRLEIDVTHRITFFADGGAQKIREKLQSAQEGPLHVDRYNRTDSAVEGGLHYSLGVAWTVSPEVQYTTTQFVLTPEQRNNKSLAYQLAVAFNRERFYLNLVGGYREGRPFQGSLFPSYSTGVGSFFASYYLRPWLEVQAHGQRRVAYSIDVINPYYFGDQLGGGFNIQVLPRALLRTFARTTQIRYPIEQMIGGELMNRHDKIFTYGGGASVITFRNISITGLVSHVHSDSNVPQARYSILQFSTFLTVSGEFMRSGEFIQTGDYLR